MGQWNITGRAPVPVTRTRFLQQGPDMARRSFIALAIGSVAPVSMYWEAAADEGGPVDPIPIAPGMVRITEPCCGETYDVTAESCQIVELLSPEDLIKSSTADKRTTP